MLFQILMTLMIKPSRSLLLLSSPDDEITDRMTMLQKLNSQHIGTKKKHFDILDLAVICPICTAQNAIFCPHRRDRVPSWISMKAQSELKDLMPDDVWRREILGEKCILSGLLFPKEMIIEFFTAEHQDTPYSIDENVFHIGIDPSGGKSKMAFAVIEITKDFHFGVSNPPHTHLVPSQMS